MKKYEEFLQNALKKMDKHNSVNYLEINNSDRETVEKLKSEGLIFNVHYINNFGVRFDLTYDGIHYFDE